MILVAILGWGVLHRGNGAAFAHPAPLQLAPAAVATPISNARMSAARIIWRSSDQLNASRIVSAVASYVFHKRHTLAF